MARKTVKVEDLKRKINHRLEHGSDSPETRVALASLLEGILMDTGNYQGFNYVAWLDGGCDQWRADGSPADNSKYLGDESRRRYY